MITLGRRLGPSLIKQSARINGNARRIDVARTSSNGPMSSGFLDNITDSLTSFRLKAANALTASLPEDERSQLLDKLQPKVDKKTDEEENTVPIQSIDEAVAAARAQEATLHSQKWEKNKENLIKEAEEAARSRIESDIAIQRRQLAFEAWKKDLEREKGETETATAANQEEIIDHPILGPVLADLGHKRIHVADVKFLASIPVWKKQRIYRHGRAKSMASDKMKTLHLGLPGIIGIFEVSLSCLFYGFKDF
jgi:hypothetical protein